MMLQDAATPGTPFSPSSPFRRSGSDSNLKRAASAVEPANPPRQYRSEHGLGARSNGDLESAVSLDVAPVRRPMNAQDRSRRHTDSPHAARRCAELSKDLHISVMLSCTTLHCMSESQFEAYHWTSHMHALKSSGSTGTHTEGYVQLPICNQLQLPDV